MSVIAFTFHRVNSSSRYVLVVEEIVDVALVLVLSKRVFELVQWRLGGQTFSLHYLQGKARHNVNILSVDCRPCF